MGNSYFKFKQFTIHQDKCAMKVSTDACIQGAWTPIDNNVQRVLDIGAGTGLLSLMCAQRNSLVTIDAIELDKDAAQQAEENVSLSDWAIRINVIEADAVQYNYKHQYDLIIVNPPFFNNSLLGGDAQRNNARHTLTLSYENLFAIIKNNIANSGTCSVLLPAESFGVWEQLLSKAGWHIAHKLHVHPSEQHEYNRVVAVCAKQKNTDTVTGKLIIRDSKGQYKDAYKKLMRPYYLDL